MEILAIMSARTALAALSIYVDSYYDRDDLPYEAGDDIAVLLGGLRMTEQFGTDDAQYEVLWTELVASHIDYDLGKVDLDKVELTYLDGFLLGRMLVAHYLEREGFQGLKLIVDEGATDSSGLPCNQAAWSNWLECVERAKRGDVWSSWSFNTDPQSS